MRLKWEERIPEAPSTNHGPMLVALLVEDNQVDRQTDESIVATLASIEIRFLQVNIKKTRDFHHGLFWQSVCRSLERLELSAHEKKKIEAAIEVKVPRPGDEWALWGVTCIPRYER
ncbi:hypothetical protein D3OALGA1CA_931 [Olavius algarvensis associated proteobacterium Delta 3]|nr:hypothetical protein D3OALGA1CA_931 [Olavius algarvensis associated proteobacterium Delta 3]CAB5129419.1 hypothetical protein D3OALGB2SA_3517 [Olavius algarvensis associated proteobacterium Delta 3]